MSRTRLWIWIALPSVVLAVMVAALVATRPLDWLAASAPPVEELAVETVRLEPGMISLTVRADGSVPLSVAQVQVDTAWRTFTQRPPGPIGRLKTARIDIPYPWIDGEAHHILLLTSSGVPIEHEIEVAQATPTFDGPTLAGLAAIGLLIGLAPVAAGLFAYPAVRAAGPRGLDFVLALTVGLLVFLLIDTLEEGLETAQAALPRLNAGLLVWVAAIAACGALLAVGRREGKAPEGVALAAFIALGIGLHNLGEGLAVGAALATGAAALATFLVVGFIIHNVTEGVGIAAALATGKPGLAAFAGLAMLAGLPAVPGVALGANAVSPVITALCFGIGAGAILQVVIEVAALLIRRSGTGVLVRPAGIAGLVAGLGIMYATALLA